MSSLPVQTAGIIAAVLVSAVACDPNPTYKTGQPAAQEFKTVRAECELEGAYTGHVTIEETKDAYTVSWEGNPVSPKKRTNFGALLTDSANHSAQVEVDYWNGKLIVSTAYIFDGDPMLEPFQVRGHTVTKADSVTTSFSKKERGLRKLKPTHWAAWYTVRSHKAANCDPLGSGYLPYPH